MKTMSKKLIIGLLAGILFTIPSLSVWAGGGPEPPQSATISDTKIWGVITMYCTPATNDLVIVRVKRVVDCNVETEIYVDAAWLADCPALGDTSVFDDWSLNGYTFFDIPGTPYITKVKNMVQEIGNGNNATSVEAQFGFWTQ